MGKTFARAPETIMSRIRQLAEDFHKDDMFIEGSKGHPGSNGSKAIHVTVEAFLVFGPRNKEGMQTGPALLVHGCPAAACIRASKLEERVAGRCDAIIHIDGDRVKTWPVATLMAVLDHELQHIELQLNGEGVPILDDIGRPLIRMRPHDHDFGWFDAIAKRHGSAAIEVCQAAAFAGEELRQLYFPGLDFPVVDTVSANAAKQVDEAEPSILNMSRFDCIDTKSEFEEWRGRKDRKAEIKATLKKLGPEPGGVPKRKRSAVKS